MSSKHIVVSLERHTEAMDKINALISVRERSVAEVRARLIRTGFSDEEVEDACSSAVRCGLVSDERYASAYIRGKLNSGWGRNRIVHNLREQGIDDEVIVSCEELFLSEDEEYEVAYAILSKHPNNSKNPYSSYVRRLTGKGYTFELAKRVAADFISQQGK